MKKLFLIFFLTFFFTNRLLSQETSSQITNELINAIKFGTKQKKLEEIKKISKLPKKDVEQVFTLVVSQQNPDFEICNELLQQTKTILPSEFILPKITHLFSLETIQEYPQFVNTTKEYIKSYKESEFVYNHIVEVILSTQTSLLQKYYYVSFLELYPQEKVLPVIKQVYTKQDILRLATANLLSVYKDEETKNILVYYLSDELPEVQLAAIKSIISRKSYELLPLILPKITNRFIGNKVKELLLQIDDVSSEKYFFCALPLFSDTEIRKVCLLQSSKYKNLDFLPSYIQMYKTEKTYEVKQLLQKIITSYDIPKTEFVFLSYLQDKELYDIVIPMLIKMKSVSSLPYLCQLYPNLPEHLRTEIDEFLLSSTDEKIVYAVSPCLNTKNLQLHCNIIKLLLSSNIANFYDKILLEVETTKNKTVISSVISSLPKIQDHDVKIKFIKILFIKVYKEPQLLQYLLSQLEEIIKKQKNKYIILVDNIIPLLSHKDNTIKEKSIELTKLIFQNSNLEEIRTVYSLLPNLNTETKIELISLLLNYPDEQFLNIAVNLFYNTNNLKLKQLLCKYIFETTKSCSQQVIIDCLRSKNIDLQLFVLEMCKNNIHYNDLQYFLPLCSSKNKILRKKVALTISPLLTSNEKIVILNFINDTEPEIKSVGIKTASKVIPQEFLEIVPKLLKSKSDYVKKITLEAIQTIPKQEIIKSKTYEDIKTNIIKLSKEGVPTEIRVAAIKTLSLLDDTSLTAVEIYFAAFISYEPKLKDVARYAFDRILPIHPSVEDIFVKGLTSESSVVQNYFVQKIFELKPQSDKIKQQLKTLILTTSDDKTRNFYFTTLSKILTDNDFYIVKELYETGSITLKWQCLEILPQFSLSEELTTFLVDTALKEEQTTLRQKAVEVAKNFIKSKRVYDAIVYISQNDTSYSVRTAATNLLKNSVLKK